jgi:hypothetical protein
MAACAGILLDFCAPSHGLVGVVGLAEPPIRSSQLKVD